VLTTEANRRLCPVSCKVVGIFSLFQKFRLFCSHFCVNSIGCCVGMCSTEMHYKYDVDPSDSRSNSYNVCTFLMF